MTLNTKNPSPKGLEQYISFRTQYKIINVGIGMENSLEVTNTLGAKMTTSTQGISNSW